ncbi:MAG: hypothetical protein J6B34_03510 [Clostridia bacterium]|nr:hypothetical protein [Clostridia bacterium]
MQYKANLNPLRGTGFACSPFSCETAFGCILERFAYSFSCATAFGCILERFAYSFSCATAFGCILERFACSPFSCATAFGYILERFAYFFSCDKLRLPLIYKKEICQKAHKVLTNRVYSIKMVVLLARVSHYMAFGALQIFCPYEL